MSSNQGKKGIPRRDFLIGGLAAGAGFLTSTYPAQVSADIKLPFISTKYHKKKSFGSTVIVVMTDSMRPDFVHCYGNKYMKTPNIDQLARDGTLFTQAYAEGLPTMPVRTAMFTGRFTLPFRGWQPLERGDVTLAEILWGKGYKSAFISDTFHMHKPQYNMIRGFDEARWIRGQEDDPYILDRDVEDLYKKHHKPRDPDQEPYEQTIQYLRNTAHWKDDDDSFVAQVVKSGIDWLERQKRGDHLFLWLDCFDPHEPFNPVGKFRTMYDPDYTGQEIINPIGGYVEGYLSEREIQHIRALNAGETSMVDKWLGKFYDALKDMGLYDNALIVHVSDHGNPLGEHGIIRKNKPWPYAESLSRIVCIVKHPEGIAQGKKIDAFAHTPDIMPTILDFLDVEGPQNIKGKSLLPLMTQEEEKNYDISIAGFFKRCHSIRDGEYSFYTFLPFEHPTLKPLPETPWKPQLYYLPEDPYEVNNIIASERAKARELEKKMNRFLGTLE